MTARRSSDDRDSQDFLSDWRGRVLSRRALLMRAAGVVSATLLPWPLLAESAASDTLDEAARWHVLDQVLRHLLPSEPDTPGAVELKALDYLKFVVNDGNLDGEDRAFLLQGAEWLAHIAKKLTGSMFVELNEVDRERVLRKIEESGPGENWLATLLLYLFEAMLADPVYGGNPDGMAWRWLGHYPGVPRPSEANRYGRLGYSAGA